jgi:hypothetical protein
MQSRRSAHCSGCCRITFKLAAAYTGACWLLLRVVLPQCARSQAFYLLQEIRVAVASAAQQAMNSGLFPHWCPTAAGTELALQEKQHIPEHEGCCERRFKEAFCKVSDAAAGAFS